MLQLLQSAQQKLYIQLQYIHPSDAPADADFKALVDVVATRRGKEAEWPTEAAVLHRRWRRPSAPARGPGSA